MSATAALVVDAAERLFEARLDEAALRRAARGEWLEEAWAAIEAMGAPLALLGEAHGGFGLDGGEALGLVRLAGAYGCPPPLGETMIANRLLAIAGLPLAEGPASLARAPGARLAREGDGWRLAGSASRVAWSEQLGALLLQVEDADGDRRLVRLGRGEWRTAARGRNLAGHPRDEVAFDLVTDALAPFDGDLQAQGAAVTALLIAGALERVLELTVEHVNARAQFGRPLAKFQAVQHACAELAGEVAAADAAADLAAEALTGGDLDRGLALAAAKLRAGEAAGRASGLAHQMHGAMGFAAEHRLHLLTTALWSWRDEHGGHGHWARRIGAHALAAGPEGFWPLVTAA